LASTLVDLDAEEVQALHITDLVFEVGKLSLNVFGSAKEVNRLVLVSESSSLNGFTLTLGLELGSVLLDIALTKLKIMFDLVSLNFILKYLFRLLTEAIDAGGLCLGLSRSSLIFISFNSSLFFIR
jgi:hypothetical protein